MCACGGSGTRVRLGSLCPSLPRDISRSRSCCRVTSKDGSRVVGEGSLASKTIHTRGTPTAQSLQGTTRNCMHHPRQRECQSSRKQSRQRRLHLLRSTTTLSGVGGGTSKSYNLKSTLPSSLMDVLLWITCHGG